MAGARTDPIPGGSNHGRHGQHGREHSRERQSWGRENHEGHEAHEAGDRSQAGPASDRARKGAGARNAIRRAHPVMMSFLPLLPRCPGVPLVPSSSSCSRELKLVDRPRPPAWPPPRGPAAWLWGDLVLHKPKLRTAGDKPGWLRNPFKKSDKTNPNSGHKLLALNLFGVFPELAGRRSGCSPRRAGA